MSRDKDQLLKQGKADPNVLSRSVYRILGERREQAPASFIETESSGVLPGYLACARVANACLASFVTPKVLSTSILLPPRTMESALREIERQICSLADALHLTVHSGHTEVSPVLTRPVVTACVSGEPMKHTVVNPSPGDGIYFAGKAGLAGTMILAGKKEEELLSRFPALKVHAMQELRQELLIASFAEYFGASSVLVACSSCGVMAALWQLAEKTGLGFSVHLDRVPILQESVEFTELFGINPYEMPSEGALLLVSSKELPLTRIGTVEAGRAKQVFVMDEVSSLNRPPQDALTGLYGHSSGELSVLRIEQCGADR